MATLNQCDRCKTVTKGVTDTHRVWNPDAYMIDLCDRCYRGFKTLFADWMKQGA